MNPWHCPKNIFIILYFTYVIRENTVHVNLVLTIAYNVYPFGKLQGENDDSASKFQQVFNEWQI